MVPTDHGGVPSHETGGPKPLGSTGRHPVTPVERLLEEAIASGCGFFGKGAESSPTRVTATEVGQPLHLTRRAEALGEDDDWSWPQQA